MQLRRFAKIFAALVALAVIALAALAFIGIDIDAQRWREPIAAALARALGREVRLDGQARLTLSLHPAIVVGDLHIANPPGFEAPDFARIGELRLVLALLPCAETPRFAGETSAHSRAPHPTRSFSRSLVN